MFFLALKSTVRKHEREADRLRAESSVLRKANSNLSTELDAAYKRIALLTDQLRVAQKNDKRDSKGKYTKAK